ncbi:MAG TPA: hypothetical protein DCY94_04030 [Firmicutes bacterium]|nr:hypothetical protein [Bacillota bacterium]
MPDVIHISFIDAHKNPLFLSTSYYKGIFSICQIHWFFTHPLLYFENILRLGGIFMLFDKNGYYMMLPKSNLDYDFAVDIMGEKMPTSLDLYTPEEGLRRGNLFKREYRPYKNYIPREITVSNAREKSLLEIQKLDFAITDLNLYLDLNPRDQEAYKLFSKYTKECDLKKEEYKRTYGPILLDGLTDEYEWSMGVWPWEEGRM